MTSDHTYEVTEEMWEAARDAIDREVGWALRDAYGPDPSLLAEMVVEAVLRASKPQGLSWRRQGRLL